jgi:hypothetical protein
MHDLHRLYNGVTSDLDDPTQALRYGRRVCGLYCVQLRPGVTS